MRIAFWLVLGASAGAVLCLGAVNATIAGLSLLYEYWWTVPLAVSFASLMVLVSFLAAGGHDQRRTVRYATRAYLAAGPSLGALNLPIILSMGPAPPFWVAYAVLGTLLCSAWAYLRSQPATDG